MRQLKMITILIDENENRIKELLGGFLRREGYVAQQDEDDPNIIKVVPKDFHDGKFSLKSKIVELENSLYYQKKGVLYKSILENVEKPMIEHALERTEGNQLKAAKMLGMNRNTIRSKIRKLGIDVSKWKDR
jgi:DNA-binding protein Fis